ncbi:aldehyde dehydrogenase family protein [Cumulibacter soli]|uniref:aldehyde dehydrogenase family protein n=1 Tax=Cumulibacter soli TaxID=2546344 RepID=UPI00106873D1|nr:aldehyde dehydrogenase family protein [Cumulibacter soli]
MTFDSLNPATNQVVGTFADCAPADVDAAVAEARESARWWGEIGFKERRKRLLAWRSVLLDRIDELAHLVCEEVGKPVEDATLEIGLAVAHIDWAAKNAAKVLRRRQVSPGMLLGNHGASVRYLPYGVVGVIGPWNYPVFTPIGAIAYALAAGNAVVFKPSEFSPAVGTQLAESFAEVVGEQHVLQVITGAGATGAALAASEVDKIAFTGSSATGRKILAACAPRLTPAILECGGKDVAIVDADADLELAAQSIVWAGCSNAGQTCIGTERVYVHQDVYRKLLQRVVSIAEGLRPGSDAGASYGPMTLASQSDVVRRHIATALADGARAVLGGVESVREPYVHPVVLTDVPETSDAMREETFGPVLIVNSVASMQDAVARANSSPYGLGAAVFSGANGQRIASELRTGMVAVNSVIAFAGIPALPFGGVGESGFGRVHGADGLREFARSQAVAKLRVPIPIVVTSFERTPSAVRLFVDILRRLRG